MVFILPLDEILFVADNLFGAKPAVFGYRAEIKMHMRRFLIVMNHRRYDSVGADLLFVKVQRPLEESVGVLLAHLCEKIGACRYYRFDHIYAVFPGTAPEFLNQRLAEVSVSVGRLNKMHIIFALFFLNIGI